MTKIWKIKQFPIIEGYILPIGIVMIEIVFKSFLIVIFQIRKTVDSMGEKNHFKDKTKIKRERIIIQYLYVDELPSLKHSIILFLVSFLYSK